MGLQRCHLLPNPWLRRLQHSLLAAQALLRSTLFVFAALSKLPPKLPTSNQSCIY
jgi:hypothetical protein